MKYKKKDNDGFTLIEVMMVIAILGIVAAAIVSTFWGNSNSSVTNSQNADMQQNARAALDYLTQDIMTAGYSPDVSFLDPGFVADFPSPNNGKGVATTASQIAFTTDANANGALDSDISELRAYRLNGGILQMYDAATTAWEDVADNIDALDFVYLDGANAVIAQPLTPASLTTIQSVEITLVARIPTSGRGGNVNSATYTNRQGTTIYTAPGDHFRRMRLCSTVKCRNLMM